jgi:hypothetical protein
MTRHHVAAFITLLSPVLCQGTTQSLGSTTLTDLVACASGDALVAFWQGASDLVLRRSADGGETWPAAATFATAGFEPAVAVLGAEVWVVFSSGSPTNSDVLIARSADRGATWATPIQVNATSTIAARRSPKLALTPLGAFVVWKEGNNSLFYNRLINGAIAGSDTVLANNLQSGFFDYSISCVDVLPPASGAPRTVALVTWLANIASSPAALAATSSNADSATPAFSSQQLSGAGTSAGHPSGRVVAGPSGTPEYYAVWQQTSGATRYSFSGVEPPAWSTPGSVSGTGTTNPVMVASTSPSSATQIVVAFEVNQEIHVRRGSPSGGVIAFEPTQVLSLPSGTTSNNQSASPKLTASGSTVLASWRTASGGSNSVYVSRSLDRGASWLLPSEARMFASPVSGPTSGVNLMRDHFTTANEDDPGVLGTSAHLFWKSSGGLIEFRCTHVSGTRLFGTPTGPTQPTVKPWSGHGANIGSTVSCEASITPIAPYTMVWAVGSGRAPIDIGALDTQCAGISAQIGATPALFIDVTSFGTPAHLAFQVPASPVYLGTQHTVTAIILNGAASGCPYDTANGMEVTVY